MWGKPEAYLDNQCMPGFHEILHLLASSKDLFFDELTCEMPRMAQSSPS